MRVRLLDEGLSFKDVKPGSTFRVHISDGPTGQDSKLSSDVYLCGVLERGGKWDSKVGVSLTTGQVTYFRNDLAIALVDGVFVEGT